MCDIGERGSKSGLLALRNMSWATPKQATLQLDGYLENFRPSLSDFFFLLDSIKHWKNSGDTIYTSRVINMQ